MRGDDVKLIAMPVIKPWEFTASTGTNGAELIRAIILAFAKDKALPFVMEFTFKEHGEFFRGALAMASLRYTGDFYEKLKQYERLCVTIKKIESEA